MKKAMQNTSPQLQRILLIFTKYYMELKYIGRHSITCKTEKSSRRYSRRRTRIASSHGYKNAESAKMKEIQEETAKDSCLMGIARYVTEG